MIAYIDTSVLVRILLRAPQALPDWDRIEEGVVSVIVRVEACRTFARLLHDAQMTLAEYEAKVAELDDVLGRVTIIPFTDRILQTASERLPVRLATLDSLHLATAIAHAESASTDDPPIRFATHDTALAAAARAKGFIVLGA